MKQLFARNGSAINNSAVSFAWQTPVINAVFSVILVSLLVGCSGAPESAAQPTSPAPAPVPAADLIVRGGVIITMDAELREQEAMAVRGHEILAVGSAAQIEPYLGENTEVLELAGRTVMPGLIEGHGHFLSLGRAQQVLDFTSTETFADLVGMVAVAADQAAPGEWIFGRGWHQDKWQPGDEVLVEGVPINDTLNAVSEQNPVLLTHASGHAAYANQAALAAAGIGLDTKDPAGGTIVRAADGQATGLLRETAQRLVEQAVARYEAGLDPDMLQRRLDEQVQLAGAVALAHGVTSFHDAGADLATIDYFKTQEAAETLPVRLYVMVRGESNATMADALADYYMPMQGNDFLTVRSIKRQIDGALGAHGAWLLEPYTDLPDTHGLVLETVADIEETARLALKHGYQVNTHAIGTRANREVLDLYERVWGEQDERYAGTDLRWRIEHAQHIHADDIPRFGQLGVIAAIQGVHCTSDGPWIPSRLGEARTQATSYRWRDLLDAGAKLNNGTDVPVEPIAPFASLKASVVRRMNNGEQFYPGQAMTVREALHSYTLGNAFSAFEEDHKGSLTPGKLADFVVLDRNPLQIDEELLDQVQVQMTFVGGEARFVAETE